MTINHAGSAQVKSDTVHNMKVGGESLDLEYPRAGQFEKEDIIILVLSLILIAATAWLATAVL